MPTVLTHRALPSSAGQADDTAPLLPRAPRSEVLVFCRGRTENVGVQIPTRPVRSARSGLGAGLPLLLLAALTTGRAEPPAVQAIPEVVVSTPEPRYVAPTRRDRIGRVWAPVFINGQGPFRMVLDTGASHSAVVAHVAEQLGISLLDADQVVLRGVTGAATVPAIAVETMTVGDLELQSRRLPIVNDALGGADGVLGTEGLFDKRIFIDFRHDNITIFRSHRQPPPPD